MLENLVSGCFLLAIPLLLLAIPKTRRMTGNWSLALKSVPWGCLTVILLPEILFSLIYLLRDRWAILPPRFGTGKLWEAVILALALAAGIFLIIGVARFLYRKFRAGEKCPFYPFVIVFFLLGGMTLTLSFAVSLADMAYSFAKSSKGDYQGTWRQYNLPEEAGVRLSFEESSIHPFLAEYNYRICFRKDGKTTCRNLMTNTGGRTFFHVFRLKDGRLFFVDKDADYIVDPAKAEILYLFRDSADPRQMYTVVFPDEILKSWGWGKENGVMIFHYGNDLKEIPAQPVSNELDGKRYYGCITDRFYTPEEKTMAPLDETRKIRRWRPPALPAEPQP